MKDEIGRILPMIKSLDYDFTKSEKKVAKYILENRGAVIYFTIIEFSEKVEVGEATIIRFCRKLRFKGFHDFKMALAQELSLNNQKNKILDEELLSTDSPNILARKISNGCQSAVEETLKLMDYKVLDEVVKEIDKAKRIYFFGVAFSGIAAIEGKYKFMLLGYKVESYTDNHFMAMVAATLGKDDLVIGISNSGCALETIKGLKIAKSQGAKTVAITHQAKSPITKEANYTLLNGTKEGPLQGGALNTRLTQLFVLELLYTKLLMNHEEKAIELKKKEREAIEEYIRR